jgi:peptide/nickel transport system permease protein
MGHFFSSKTARFSFTFLATIFFFGFFAYWIVPDGSPNVNDGAVQIQKKPPVFTVKVLKTPRHYAVPPTSWWSQLLNGKESPYQYIPLAGDPEVLADKVFYTPYGSEEVHVLSLIDCVKRPVAVLYEQGGQKQGLDESTIFYYVDEDNEVHPTSLATLREEFYTHLVGHKTFWLGTDKAGRDVLSRLVLGARVSLGIGITSVCISLLLGILAGSVAGFLGGKADAAVQWCIQTIWSVPAVLLAMAFSVIFQQKGLSTIFLAIGITMWIDIARIVRDQVKWVKKQSYIHAARIMGFSFFRVLRNHILPNISGPVLAVATTNFTAAILLEAGLSFLGLGIQPPTPSWGMMVHEGYQAMGSPGSWHLVVLPASCITLTVLAFQLLSNRLWTVHKQRTGHIPPTPVRMATR